MDKSQSTLEELRDSLESMKQQNNIIKWCFEIIFVCNAIFLILQLLK